MRLMNQTYSGSAQFYTRTNMGKKTFFVGQKYGKLFITKIHDRGFSEVVCDCGEIDGFSRRELTSGVVRQCKECDELEESRTCVAQPAQIDTMSDIERRMISKFLETNQITKIKDQTNGH